MGTAKFKILVVDDDENISELITMYLNKENYDTRETTDGRSAILIFKSYDPDLILLDLMLPGIDGYQVCREIRQISSVPIIMLTAKGDIFDKVLGLELGADDYIVKPFDPKELVARVKAALRRRYSETPEKETPKENGEVITLPNLTINYNNYSVLYHGNELDFPPKEFELLYFLAKNPNRVFTRDQLLNQIWGFEFKGDTRTVDVHVKRIREKLPYENSWNIKTVWGVGYKFENKNYALKNLTMAKSSAKIMRVKFRK
jgi:DNA-binding response OmpR family regulator